MAELKRLLRDVWDAHRQATTSDAIAALLGEADQRVRDLGRQLYPFTTAGGYGRFFNGPNTVDLGRPFVVLVPIDEDWELLAQGDVARFIESGYCRFRKYRVSPWSSPSR